MATYSDRPYKTLTQAADYLGYQGTKRGKQSAARKFIARTGIPKYWRGKAWVYHPDDLDAALKGAAHA